MPYKDPEAKKAQARRHYLANKEKYKQWRAAWKAANPERDRELTDAWHKANPERVKEIKKAYAERTPRTYKPDPVRQKAAYRRWLENNRDKANAYSMNRRASRIARTPGWFGELDELVVKEATRLAKQREQVFGFKWHVDHVIPLRGKTVSGLHVHNNLAVIPAVENRRKWNKLLTPE